MRAVEIDFDVKPPLAPGLNLDYVTNGEFTFPVYTSRETASEAVQGDLRCLQEDLSLLHVWAPSEFMKVTSFSIIMPVETIEHPEGKGKPSEVWELEDDVDLGGLPRNLGVVNSTTKRADTWNTPRIRRAQGPLPKPHPKVQFSKGPYDPGMPRFSDIDADKSTTCIWSCKRHPAPGAPSKNSPGSIRMAYPGGHSRMYATGGSWPNWTTLADV